MSFKTTYWLFGTLLGIVAVVGLALYFDPAPEDQAAFVFPNANTNTGTLTAEHATRIVLERTDPKETLTFERDPNYNRWRMTSPTKAEADRFQVEDLINKILRAKRKLKPGSLGAPDTLGLNPPRAVVTLDVGDKQFTLKVGDTTFGDKEGVIYAISSDRPETLVIPKNDLDLVNKPSAQFRERELLAAAPTNVQSVKLTHAVAGKEKEAPVELVKQKDRWLYQSPFKGEADSVSADAKVEPNQPPSSITALLSEITRIRADFKDKGDSDFVASNVTDWKQYGLDATADLLTVEITRSESARPKTAKEKDSEEKPAATELSSTQTLVIALGKKADEKADKYYARRGGEDNVYKIPGGPVVALLKLVERPDAVRDRHLLTIDGDRRVPDAIRIKKGGDELEFYKRDAIRPWQMYRSGAATPANVDQNVLKGLLKLLSEDRMIEAFPDPKTPAADLGFDANSVVASFWVDGVAAEKKDDKDEKKEEAKPDPNAKPALKDADKPTAKLTFGKRNPARKTVYVKRELPGEEPGIFEVREVLFDRISEGPLAYLDPKLAGFREGASNAAQNVTKLVFTHKGKTTELVRAKDSEPWKFVQPKEYADRAVDAFAVESLLNSLNTLRANKYLVEKATPEKLAADYGLNPPASKAEITVTVDGKSSVYEILFGKDATEPANLFAKLGGAYNNDVVFTLDRATLNAFEREILDPTVFNFDPTKVKEVLLKGWSGTAGFTVTLDLVRKDDKTWEVRTGPPKDEFTLDSAKVNTFLMQLARLRADGFVSHGKAPEPAQELDVKLGGLSIKLTVDGEKDPLTLLVGKAEGSSYLALASKLQGDVIQVSKALFEGVKGSVAYFKK